MLTVKNTNSFQFASRYNGIDMTFPINEKVMIDPEAARHIFGFGADDQARHDSIVKHGWASTSNEMEDGRKVLAKFVFVDMSEPMYDEPQPEAVAPPVPEEDKSAAVDSAIPSFVGSGRRSKT